MIDVHHSLYKNEKRIFLKVKYVLCLRSVNCTSSVGEILFVLRGFPGFLIGMHPHVLVEKRSRPLRQRMNKCVEILLKVS